MSSPKRKLLFNDGNVVDSDTILLASQFHEHQGKSLSRLSLIKNMPGSPNGEWFYLNLDDTAVSVTSLRSERLAFWLGRFGRIRVFGQGPARTEFLPNSGKYGDFLRIRSIGDVVYVCGMTGQVLVRKTSGWTHMDDGLLGEYQLDFEDIDGNGPDDIYAVGLKGAICHYDGKAWSRLDSPTNQPLSNVRCASSGEVYICGNKGTFLKGSHMDGWEFIGRENVTHNFWGLAIFRGMVFTSYVGGIYVYNGVDMTKVSFEIQGPIECHRLDANEQVLWSFGVDNLMYFDGYVWRRVVCPLNE